MVLYIYASSLSILFKNRQWYSLSLSVVTENRQWCPCPLYKTNRRPHTRSHTPTNSHTLISHVSLSLLKKSTLSLSMWFGHGSCIFQWYWYVVFSNILSIFIWCIFIFMFLCILHLYIFLFHAFDLYLIRWYEQRTSPTTRTRFPPWRWAIRS